MESKEKCEQIIKELNNQPMPKLLDAADGEEEAAGEGADDSQQIDDGAPLLQVKFADSGKKPRRQNISTSLEVSLKQSMCILSSLTSPTSTHQTTW